MSEAPLSMGVVHSVSAESFGEPGNRTFRLRASTGPGEISIWLEKEQIVALGGAIGQILERVPTDKGTEPQPTSSAVEISGEVSARAASLSLSFDEAQNAFAFEASDLWEATLEVSGFVLLASRRQIEEMEEQIQEIVSGGRPRCSMCGRPLGPGPHFCPPSNGHAAVLDEPATQ